MPSLSLKENGFQAELWILTTARLKTCFHRVIYGLHTKLRLNQMSCTQVLGDAASAASIWYRKLGWMSSCQVPEAVAQDAAVARSCSDDPTAIDVDLTRAGSAEEKSHCFHYTSDCSFDINKVKEISFDLSAQGCADVWAAPLWMVPPKWGPTQRVSGEIDFFEFCKGNPNVSFGSSPTDYSQWSVDKNNVKGQVHIRFDQAKDIITTQICDPKGQNCKSGYTRTGYFADIKKSVNPSGAGMTFVSDIWNGSEGDQGFDGCANGGKHDSSCSYSVRNIKVASSSGEKLFSNTCAALNA